MCGIAGVVRRGRLEEGDVAACERMTAALAHRGPDGSGLLERRQAVLGHRRLAIVDLTDQAGQPMVAADADVAITYNGEVYNMHPLREELLARGHRFLSRSDTEVVLQGWRAWGPDLPRRLNGMWACGVWDEAQGALFLSRDRYGEKPLFYAELPGGGLAFASELRALLEHPQVPRELDRRSLAKFLAFDAFPGPATPFRAIKKLRPGHSLLWRDGRVQLQRDWQRRYGTLRVSVREATEELWRLLRRSVELRLMSDVPLGVFLSAGVDSSAVLAAMHDLIGPARIQAFSIGFEEPGYDESQAARAIAAHFGVRHEVQVLSSQKLLQLLPEILDHMDEPLADHSLVPTYALCKFARQQVTVALGGDGGDELFAGYDTFVADRLARPLLRAPGLVRRALGGLVGLLPPSPADMSLQFRASRFVNGLDPDPFVRHQRWFGSFQPEEAAALIPGAGSAADVYEDLAWPERPTGRHSEQAPLELMTSYYLPDDVLTKVDRASMAVSLEARAPLLDPELAAFAHGLPYRMKLHGLTRKWILKRALRGRLPGSVLRRKKQGFRPPNAEWLRGALRPEVERLLDPRRLEEGGLLDPRLASQVVREHLSGERDHRKQVWALFVLERWRERWAR